MADNALATHLADVYLAHRGDSLGNDVIGAQQAGLRAAWLNRRGRPKLADARPYFEIASLAELITVCVDL